MKSDVSIINYGLGNIAAFKNIYNNLNISSNIASTIQDIEDSTRLILPGVGSFDWAMNKISNSNLKDVINYKVKEEKIPILGVCVGMQIMAKSSEEGILEGFGWIDGRVIKMQLPNQYRNPLPHMGWNDIQISDSLKLFDGLPNQKFYFLHSYQFVPNDSASEIATTHYGNDFCSAVNSGNIYGVQFHPEKSHEWGINLLKNFAKI